MILRRRCLPPVPVPISVQRWPSSTGWIQPDVPPGPRPADLSFRREAVSVVAQPGVLPELLLDQLEQPIPLTHDPMGVENELEVVTGEARLRAHADPNVEIRDEFRQHPELARSIVCPSGIGPVETRPGTVSDSQSPRLVGHLRPCRLN